MKRLYKIRLLLLLILLGGAVRGYAQTIRLGGDIFGGGEGYVDNTDPANSVVTSADVGGNTNVRIYGGKFVVEQYSAADETDDPTHVEGMLKRNHNVYGGGNLACVVEGNTNVLVKAGLLPVSFFAVENQSNMYRRWGEYVAKMERQRMEKAVQGSVFGAGFGVATRVNGNANVNLTMGAESSITSIDDIQNLFDLAKKGGDATGETLASKFVLTAFGGGYDGTVAKNTNVTISGSPFLQNVFGGGLGSKAGADANGGFNSQVGTVEGGTSVKINGATVYGNVFGGGAGVMGQYYVEGLNETMPYSRVSMVKRQTDVTIGASALVFGNVYGGGDIANTGWYDDVSGRPVSTHQDYVNGSGAKLDLTTSLHLEGGNVMGMVFGGGNGRTKDIIARYDFIGAVIGNTSVVLGKKNADGTYSGGSKVWNRIYGGGQSGMVYSCKEMAQKANGIARDVGDRVDGCTNVEIKSGDVGNDIFGGGLGDVATNGTDDESDDIITSADISGNTYVFYNRGNLISGKYWSQTQMSFADADCSKTKRGTESDITYNLYGGGNMACVVKGNANVYMTGAPVVDPDFTTTPGGYYEQAMDIYGCPHFSVFGAGFGKNAKVKGNTNNVIALTASGFHSIVGGGMNGPVAGICNTNVASKYGVTKIHNVYGGGYYAPVGGASLNITEGYIVENVYGGGLMGNIAPENADMEKVVTETTIGTKNMTNSPIVIAGSVYGGNDVSGTVNGVAKLNIYGGTIHKDVYGAGNGDHVGYYEPGTGRYDEGAWGGENYFLVDHSGDTSADEKNTVGPKGKTYVGRPQTVGGVELTIAGNSTSDRVKILGQVFGGGNSCTVGGWNKNLLTESNPHEVRDNPDYFVGGGKIDITLGAHITLGRNHAQLEAASESDKNDYLQKVYINGKEVLENVSGLYMGCSGRHLATQTTDPNDHSYHYYYDLHTAKYWPGFIVYKNEAGHTNEFVTRAEGLSTFRAYMNNILIHTDNVRLTFADNAEDIWMANFVGGGFRGSMKAKTAEGQFHYTLPRGVTVGHNVIGGAFNTDVVYRIFQTIDGHTYTTDKDGNYQYLTDTSNLQIVDSEHPNGDYHHIEYKDGTTDVEGIVRFYYDGGMLSELAYGTDAANNTRIGRVFEKYKTLGGGDDYDRSFAGAEQDTDKAFGKYKGHALVYLDLQNGLQTEKLRDENGVEHVHGGNVFGGCFASGRVEGDIWTDYRCFQDNSEAFTEDFNLSDKNFTNAKDFHNNFAMMLFGAGYGAETNIQGDVYLRVLHQEKNPITNTAYGYPRLYNVFGGSYEGKVEGSTNIYFNSGKYGYVAGSMYGGGCNGYVGGKTFIELAGGYIDEVYGGARNANIGGGTHIWAYDGINRPWGEGVPSASEENAPLFISKLYGGTDVAGKICTSEGGLYDAAKGWGAKFCASSWPAELYKNGSGGELKTFDSYVHVGGTTQSDRGFPVIGQVFAGGNGEKTTSSASAKYGLPDVKTAMLEVQSGNIVCAFGGGNRATVTNNNYIYVNTELNGTHSITGVDDRILSVLKKRLLNVAVDCYDQIGGTLNMRNATIQRLFGGNNVAVMAIQPKWMLKRGSLNNVYSGGNMGVMTYKGLQVNIDQPDIHINSLFGGCRIADIRPAMDNNDVDKTNEDFYGATVNISDGYVENVFGGNDVSGKIEYGTKVNVTGGMCGNVYGSGNGFYLYDLDENATKISEEADEEFGLHYTIPSMEVATLDQSMFHTWNGYDANATQMSAQPYWDASALNAETNSGATIFGSSNVTNTDYADLSEYKNLIIEGMAGTPLRILTNRQEDNSLSDESVEIPSSGKLVYDIAAKKDAWGFFHLNAIKIQWGGNGMVSNLAVSKSDGDGIISDTKKILLVNETRPLVEKTNVNISGTAERKAYVKGNVYCGGNATSVKGANSFTKLNIGSYTILGGVFLGSDGWAYSQDEHISKFARLNDIADMGAATEGTDAFRANYPQLLNLYMEAVEMETQPKETIWANDLTDTYIGTFCGGGNRGSMLATKMVEMPFHKNLVIFDKIVAGCLDATVSYNQGGTIVNSVGGYYRAVNTANNGMNGNTKIKYNIDSKFVPMVMDVPADQQAANAHGEDYATAKAKNFLYENVVDGAYNSSGNIYGGCYQTGEVIGDVELNVHSQMLSNADEAKLKAAIANDQACFNVYGAGFGQDTHVRGDIRINAERGTDGVNPSFNNIFGGGRNGQLTGNTTIMLRSGNVFSDVAGGCFASDMYGSTQIVVGYPIYYKCNTTGEYSLVRGDQWNTEYKDKDGSPVLKKKIWYQAGDLVPKNVYEQIVESSKSDFSLVNTTPTDWDNVEIRIGGGIYGGGYSLANSTTGGAGTVTTHKRADNYGGNSSIMVGDNVSGDKDHIHISTLIATEARFNTNDWVESNASEDVKKNTVGFNSVIGKFVKETINNKECYTHQGDGRPIKGTTYYNLSGDGGIYGDGHLTFVEGFRAADITGYGYAEGTPKHPVLMNTFQRLDLLSVNDCCLMLQGAKDFATDQVDATVYSLTRVNELRMNSSIDATSTLGQISKITELQSNESSEGEQFDTKRQRNYLAFFNNVHYMGSIITNDEFDVAKYHYGNGIVDNSNTYQAKKASYISAYTNAADKNSALLAFKQRNVGTARNAIGINNGYCLRVQNQYYTTENNKLVSNQYYGPIVGVCEVKLLTLVQGEGGGYVYADNVHGAQDNFLNTSGNFVFPGIVNGGSIGSQYIVDDCFRDHFGTPQNITQKEGNLDEAHYWYVEGNKYFYNTTLTGYTFNRELTFNLIDNDPNVILSGMQQGSLLKVKSVDWLSAHSQGYKCALENPTQGKVDDYEFDFEIGGAANWTDNMPRYTTDTGFADAKPLATNSIPQFNIRLVDKLDNSGNDKYYNHLNEPEKLKVVLEGKQGNQVYTYTVNLDIVYIKGPSYTGGVSILNCALPGERIGFSSSGIKIETDETMPVTAQSWKLLPRKADDTGWLESTDTEHGVTEIPANQYQEDVNGHVTGWIPALYGQNKWNIAYTFVAGGHEFPVLPEQNLDVNPNPENRMMIVHNYHRMKDVATYQLAPPAGSRLYIEDEEDLGAFINFLNSSDDGMSSMDVILQKDITLINALPVMSKSFAGTLHGDGYHINLNSKGTSLFGEKLTGNGKVYNLGMIGGTVTTVEGKAINCYVYEKGNDDFGYGRKAYELSHTFTPTTDANTYSNYVHNYYANGDYQYATVGKAIFDGVNLRTGTPNYRSTATRHIITHNHDAKRWNSDQDKNVPLYDASADAYANDYLFFGQHLDKTSGDAYPVRINQQANGDAVNQQGVSANGGNRVYKAAGYYQSCTDSEFYYNKDAWALYATLTAIDFTEATAESDNANAAPSRFTVDSNADAGNTDHVTQNLLVYCNEADKTVFAAGTYGDNIPETDIRYHAISNGTTDYLHLVDRQDFWAPKQFTVNQRTWYQRYPQNYRNVGDGYYGASAWEGIVLPFTVKRVIASQNGEISHFFGSDELHHEYWLRGLTAVTTADDMTKATFARPSEMAEYGFVDSRQTAAKFNYVYRNNYFANLINYDRTEDFGKHYADASTDGGVTFESYLPLTAGIPYIVSFPGQDFYEFSMEDQTELATFESTGTTVIPLTGIMKTSANGYDHVGTFLHVDCGYGMNDGGSAFDNAVTAVLPFRTYLDATQPQAHARRIMIGETDADDVDVEGSESADLKIWSEDGTLYIRSTYDTTLAFYTVSGIKLRDLDVWPGVNKYEDILPGTYIIGKTKVMIR